MAELRDYMMNRVIASGSQVETARIALAEANDQIVALQSELEQLQNSIHKIGYTVSQIGDGVFELVKTDEMKTGDYTDPIKFEAGMSVKAGLWYYTDDPELPMEAIADGVPAEFGDAQFFDGIPA